jgi:hypothetical protein
LAFIDCRFEACSIGVRKNSGTGAVAGPLFYRCAFVDNGTGVLYRGMGLTVVCCVFTGNTVVGISCPDNHAISGCIVGNIFYDENTGIALAHTQAQGMIIEGNIFSVIGDYAIDYTGGGVPLLHVDRNAFHACTSGHHNNLAAGPNDITLTADPFSNAAAGNFNLNNDENGGRLLREASITLPAA